MSLLSDEMLAHAAHEGEQFTAKGPTVALQAKAAESLSLALHELTTNAVKHGALSGERGKIDIAWRVENGEAGELRFLMTWRESGGPPARLPTHRGFGSKAAANQEHRARGETPR